MLDDAYFSNYEVIDPNSDTILGTDVSSSNGPDEPETTVNISYSYVNNAGTTVTVPSESIWQAVSLYAYQPNTFIDSLNDISAGGGNGNYRTAWPYYGPL